ncbi:MAG: NAD-binding protein [Motiliproteus sp.]|nr:NAD-binding protein [Motiliproteus sp.]MCW9051038.1 NAD-binding protein [Motiliproteus sp.]
MNHILFVLLRRLRTPLITVIVVYAVSILGFVLIPGVDDEGNVWRMDFFHAFYFVSFMGSTIGFGEIPYAFTDGQRMWTIVTIYATVISWLYGIGKMLSIFQDQAFIRLMNRLSFVRDVKRLREPFYLVCGYGMTGARVVEQLSKRGIQSVIVDIDRERIDALETDEIDFSVPGLCADASQPDVLSEAGLESPYCVGVLPLTDHDTVNLAISIASKLIAPDRPVICRTESDITTANLASFGTDHIIDPFVTYAEYLALALHSPYKHLAYDWLTNPEHRSITSAYQETQGRWVICGYGRFGRALYQSFKDTPVELTIIDYDRSRVCEEIDFVEGLGTEAVTLDEARIRDAVGLIAGTDDDANNLSIIMTALELNPKLITVARQNLSSNARVFDAARTDLVMEPSRIIANNILSLIKTSLLGVFLDEMVHRRDDVWAHELVNRMSTVAGDQELDSWAFTVDPECTPALSKALEEGKVVDLSLFQEDPRGMNRHLSAFPLMLKRGEQVKLLPDESTEVQAGDAILFCGLSGAFHQMQWTVSNFNVFSHVIGDTDGQGGWLARWYRKKKLS